MYAQVIESRLSHEGLGELERVVRRELLPALRREPEFCGALSLLARERDAVLLVLLWETEAAARAHVLAAAVPGVHSVRIWEVNARG